MEKKCKIIYLNNFIYILSDDEIKEGDYFLADNRLSQSSNSGKPNWIVCKCTEVKNTWKYCNEIPNEGHNGDWSKKIIVTTDTSLKQFIHTTMVIDEDDMYKSLPQPSEQFITKYIESYNKGEVITDVLVEYETLKTTANNKHFGEGHIYSITNKLKINPKDNTITIKKLKDSFNLEEMYKLMDDYQDYLFKTNDPVKTFKEWFNLQ